MSVQRIDDLIVLGRSSPESIKDGRHTVCLGGYSPTVGYVRLYPTQMKMHNLKRWNVTSVPIDPEAEGDVRDESYKIAGSRDDWDNLSDKVDTVGRLEKPEQIRLVDELAVDCPAKLNDERKSMGIVEPRAIHDVWIEERDTVPVQVELGGGRKLSKKNYPHRLRVKYRCVGCEQKSRHNQHCIEWGVYRYFDRNDDPEGVIDALHVNDPDYKCYFFIGNLRHRQMSFVIISVLRFRKVDMVKAGITEEPQTGLDRYAVQ